MEDKTRQFIEDIESSVREGCLDDSSEQGNTLFLNVLPRHLMPVCRACMEDGAVFDSAFVSSADPAKGEFTLYYLFRAASIGRMVVVASRGSTFDALSETVNAALWDERKIQDLTGLQWQASRTPAP